MAPGTRSAAGSATGRIAGSLDREFEARDDKTGTLLWSARLGDTPTGAPISFSVRGKQYVAVLTGWGSPITRGFLELVPEIDTPLKPDASVYVFALD